MIITYEIKNKITEEYYIGVESNYSPTRKYFGSGVKIKQAIEKYGTISFDKIITGVWRSKEIAFLMEAWIVDYDTIKDPLCYNMKPGGAGGAKKGHLKGIKKSATHAKAIGDALRNRKRPKSVGEAVSIAKKGKSVPNLRGEQNGMYGKYGNKNPSHNKHWVIHPISKAVKFTKYPGLFYENGWVKGSCRTKFIKIFDDNGDEMFFGSGSDLKNLSHYLPVTEFRNSAKHNGELIYKTGIPPKAVRDTNQREFYKKYQNWKAVFLAADDCGKL